MFLQRDRSTYQIKMNQANLTPLEKNIKLVAAYHRNWRPVGCQKENLKGSPYRSSGRWKRTYVDNKIH